MPKYLIQASYTAEGLQGVIKDTASGRKAAVQKAAKSLGGKVESLYFTFGKDDVVVIVDLPGNTAAATISLAAGSSGLVHLRTTPLLTVEEVDEAIGMKSKYRAPGTE
ncbi:MAG TPA: GYD domain-containing protein [Bryobacteraceae bacterium]|nr:GYD domain-containing protein [Bryobacteraceae bacterium]